MIHCGSGGVGKTTTAAAAAAMAAVHHGGKVLVLTVDPARRLANALGLETFGNVETQVPLEAFAEAGVEPRGELWAAMLDTKQSWDDLVRRHAPDAATRDAILANPLYKNITGRFVQSHDYIAMERLYEIHASGTYDLIVVDTPPTRNAIDFLEAPERMADFFSSRLLRWLTVPARSRVLNFASKPFYSVADRILGSKFLEDIAEFFLLFQTMYDGFVDRAKAVTRTLADNRTTFVVVSTLESAPVREAEFFIDALDDRGFHLGAVVLNKVLPSWFLDKGATGAAKELCARLRRARRGPPRLASASPSRSGRVLREVGESFLNFQVVAKREAEIRAELQRGPRGRRGGALLRPRHHRPRGPARPRPADLAVSGPSRATRSPWRRGTPPPPPRRSRSSKRAATRSMRASRLGSRRQSPSRRSPAWRAAASSWPAPRRARRCCSTSSSTPRAAAGRRRARRWTSKRWSCSSPAPSRASTWASARWRSPVAWPACCTPIAASAASTWRWSPLPPAASPSDGVEVNDQQAYVLRILEPILTRTPEAAEIAAPGGRLLAPGDRLRQPRPGGVPVRPRRARLRRARAGRRGRARHGRRRRSARPPPTSRATR